MQRIFSSLMLYARYAILAATIRKQTQRIVNMAMNSRRKTLTVKRTDVAVALSVEGDTIAEEEALNIGKNTARRERKEKVGRSKIEWTDFSFNGWMGCTKVSPACANCYAERDMDHRYHKVQWGPHGTRVLTSDANWRKPLQWEREAVKNRTRYRVFCDSLADVFEDWRGPIYDNARTQLFRHVSDECGWVGVSQSIPSGDLVCSKCGSWCNPVTMQDVRDRLFALIDKTPHLDWLLLTKRPENIRQMWPKDFDYDLSPPRAKIEFSPRRQNVWLGTSIENQEWAERRIPQLAQCGSLCSFLFVSAEPLVGPIDLTKIPEAKRLSWVITGGESGPHARPADPDWFRSLRDQCRDSKTAFHFKQWGEFDEQQQRVGKKNAGRLLDGQTHDEVPEFPF